LVFSVAFVWRDWDQQDHSQAYSHEEGEWAMTMVNPTQEEVEPLKSAIAKDLENSKKSQDVSKDVASETL
jgi:hypothetical protein